MNRRHLLLGLLLAAGAPHLSAKPPVGATYSPGPFHSLSFDGSVTVQFVQGDRDEVFVEGDDDTQKLVVLELRNEKLTLRSPGGFRLWASQPRLKVRIQARELKSLQISGACDFVANDAVEAASLRVSISGAGLARFDRLRAQELLFQVSGSGDGHFSGSAEQLSIGISGRGDFLGEELQTRRARVTISGVGKAKVWTTAELTANISGIGTLEYWGQPTLQRRASGLSTFTDMGPKPVARQGP